jgi:hypothetical protein
VNQFQMLRTFNAGTKTGESPHSGQRRRIERQK